MNSGEVVETRGAGGRRLYGRLWAPPGSTDVVVTVHGVMSHSLWFGPVGAELSRSTALLVVDRRGSGLDPDGRGDAESRDALLEDLDAWIEFAGGRGDRVHLCGHCWGANYAVDYLATRAWKPESLVLLVPGIFPTSRIREIELPVGDGVEPTVEVPIRGVDFTTGPFLKSFIAKDDLKVERISPRFVGVQKKVGSWVPVKLAKYRGPLLVVLAEKDTVSDNEATLRMVEKLRGEPQQTEVLPSAHGVNFETPAELARILENWVETLAGETSATD